MKKKVKDKLLEIENGSKHILLWDYETGEIYIRTIWQNLIPDKYLDMKIYSEKLSEDGYELRLGIK